MKHLTVEDVDGITYERHSIETHFEKIGDFDPLTRRPCTKKDLIPNLSLREAIEDFLAENGWAAGIWSSAIITFVLARQTYWPHAELYIDRLLNDIIGILNHTSYLFTFCNNKIDITINWTWLATKRYRYAWILITFTNSAHIPRYRGSTTLSKWMHDQFSRQILVTDIRLDWQFGK